MNKNKWNGLIMLLVLLALIIPSRVIGIDKVVTIDEPWWTISGSNYYYALTHKDFANTLYDYHPAVTTSWLVAVGMLSYFPEYRSFGQGYFDVRKPKFEDFMRSHEKEAIDLVRNSRLFQSALLVTLAILGFFLLQMLVDRRIAFVAIAMTMNAPFFLGNSRLLIHEGMLAMFVLVSLLSMQVYLNKEHKPIYLLISGMGFGFAQLTKSSSIVVAGVVGLMLFIELFKQGERSLGSKVLSAIRVFAIWLAAAAIVYIAVWPGMWVSPGKMLAGVYGNAFSYVFQGARLDVVDQSQSSGFSLGAGLDGMAQYLRSWASSTTPLSWLGMIFSIFALVSKDKQRLPAPIKSTLVYLAVLGGLFIALFGIAQGRNAVYYILTSYVCFDVAAGIGWGYVWMWMQNRWSRLNRIYIPILFFVTLIGIQISFGLPYAPYYFNYKSPFASQVSMYGYGEGMSEAAEYLARKPNAQDIRAYVYNGMGTFSFFFPGKTLVFKRIYLLEGSFATITEDMRNSDYLVLYPIVRKKHPETEVILEALQVVQPEKIIYINGLEYVSIYKISDIPESVYDKLNGN